MIYGYARVSRETQNLERQIENLNNYNSSIIVYKEKYSSMSLERPQFKKLLSVITTGDTIIFDSVSRMSRNSVEGANLYTELLDKGIDLIFLKESDINTTTIREELKRANELSLGADIVGIEHLEKFIKVNTQAMIKARVESRFNQAEKEILDTRQRTKEGLARAKANGTVLGRKEGVTLMTKRGKDIKEKLKKHSKKFGGSMTDKEFIEAYNVSKSTLVKYKREIALEEK